MRKQKSTVEIKANITKQLLGILSPAQNPIKDYSDKVLSVMDPANVCMVVALNDFGKEILSQFVEADDKLQKLPELSFIGTSEAKSKYSFEYLQKIIKLFAACEAESLIISVQKDYPSIYEGLDFKVILAPKVSSN